MELVPITSKLYYTISISLISAEARDKGKREYRPRVAHPEGYYIKCINWGIRGHNSCFRVQGTYDADRGLYITQIVDDKQRDHVYIETTHNSQPDFQQVLTVFREELERQWEKWKSTTADEGPSLAGAEGDNNFQDGSYKGSASDQSISEAGDANDDTNIGQDLENNHQGAPQDPQESLATPKARDATLPLTGSDDSSSDAHENIEGSSDTRTGNFSPTGGQAAGEQANDEPPTQISNSGDDNARTNNQNQDIARERRQREAAELEVRRLKDKIREWEQQEQRLTERLRIEEEETRLAAEAKQQEKEAQSLIKKLLKKIPIGDWVQWVQEHPLQVAGGVVVVAVLGFGGWVVLSEAAFATTVRHWLFMAGEYVVKSLLPTIGRFVMRNLTMDLVRNCLKIAIPGGVILKVAITMEDKRRSVDAKR
ncbi:hypothetical protein M408DRAFT_20081 [Serendipita vermifera MAFF 305830]|uniref:Uncharacterized protein n=1 Tax=Serendipita vermifera MAFF 305830 TaxID=933852 RepID=A0A0C2X3D4_SERVB|nr:hypothetical protein M408DRAFT_20081 [Serendipita vermifera MAFF 305830]